MHMVVFKLPDQPPRLGGLLPLLPLCRHLSEDLAETFRSIRSLLCMGLGQKSLIDKIIVLTVPKKGSVDADYYSCGAKDVCARLVCRAFWHSRRPPRTQNTENSRTTGPERNVARECASVTPTLELRTRVR